MTESLVEKIKQKIYNAYISLEGMTPIQCANVDNGLAKLEKDVSKILEDEAEQYPSLTVALAERVHVQWAGWTSYMLANMTPENIQRWKRQMKTCYEKLSEKEQETDYALAHQFIPIILRYSKLVEKQKLQQLRITLENPPIDIQATAWYGHLLKKWKKFGVEFMKPTKKEKVENHG